MPLGKSNTAGGRTSHNGGLLQVSPNFLQYGQDFAFMNVLKGAQEWTGINTNAVITPDTLDSNGYPTSIVDGGVRTVCYVPTQTERPGRYAITWDGANGTAIYTGMSLSGATGSQTSSGGTNRYEFLPGTNRFLIGISTTGVSNMKCFHVDDEADLNAGKVFGRKFKERLTELGVGAVRFGDWNFMNVNSVTNWASRKPTTYVYYYGDEYRSAIYGGTTSGSGDTYTVSAPSTWSGLVDKAQVIVKWDSRATPSSAATLNVGGTGDKGLRYATGEAFIPGYNMEPASGYLGHCIFDADLDVWLMFGGSLGHNVCGLKNGVPYEICVQLCNELGAHPHFTLPQMAADPPTDFARGLAAYCRDYGGSWMKPRFEGPNETWNTIFRQTGYASNKSLAHWGSSSYHEWYGMVMSNLGQDVKSTYSNNTSRYEVVCGVQTYTTPSSSNARMTAAAYVAQAAAAPSGYVKQAASVTTTAVATAQYIAPSEYQTLAELSDGYRYKTTYLNDPHSRRVIAENYAATLLGSAAGFNIASAQSYLTAWQTWASGYSCKQIGYEGGYSPDYLSSQWPMLISAVTKDAGGAVVTISGTYNPQGDFFDTATYGLGTLVGMSLTISGVGGMTQLNGNTYTVTGVGVASGLTASQVRINVNSSGFTTYTSGGTASHTNASNEQNMLKEGSKRVAGLESMMYTFYKWCTSTCGIETPALFFLAGSSRDLENPVQETIFGQAWGLYDPSIWSGPTPYARGMMTFGNGR